MKKNTKERMKIKGVCDIFVIDAKSKQVIKKFTFTNLLTNDGLKMHRNWAAGIPPLTNPDFNVDTRITHIAVGDGNSTPAATQTALDNELLRKEVYPTPDVGCEIVLDANEIVAFVMFIDETELNGEVLREIALFSTTFTDFMVSRFLCGNLTKNSSIQFLLRYKYVYSS